MNRFKSLLNLLPIVFFFTLGSPSISAQKPIELNGYMGVQGGELFNYKIELFPVAPQHWEGYSYTYSNIQNIVKATISVHIIGDSIFNIQEHQLIYNKGFKSKATICLLNASLGIDAQKKEIKGSILTRTDIQQSLCSGGTLTFIQEKEIQQLFENTILKEAEQSRSVTKAAPKPNPSTVANAKLQQHFQNKAQKEEFEQQKQKRQAERNALQQPEQKEITEGKAHIIKVKGDPIDFFIWDGGKIDYDQISIYVNNQVILEKYTLTAHLKKLTIPIDQPQVSIKILALNEGNEPPNTADIVVKDGTNVHHILSYNVKGKFAEIILVKDE